MGKKLLDRSGDDMTCKASRSHCRMHAQLKYIMGMAKVPQNQTTRANKNKKTVSTSNADSATNMDFMISEPHGQQSYLQ